MFCSQCGEKQVVPGGFCPHCGARATMTRTGAAATGEAPVARPAAHAPLEPPLCDDRAIWDVSLSRWHLPAVTVAIELGLFALLETGPQSREGIRARLGIGARGAEALTGVLASLGFLAQRAGQYSLTAVARTYLVPGRPYYWGPMLARSHRAGLSQGHGGLLEALRRDAATESLVSGSAEDEGRSGVEAWARGEIDPQMAQTVTAAMHSQSFPAAFGVARRGDFAGVRRLLDVAGGSGCVCIALALCLPDLRCTVLELAPVCELAARYAAEYGVADVVDTHAAHMFVDPWPDGYDAHFFGNIFHDWGEERRRFLARRSLEALPSGGRIYLHEMLLADTADGPLPAAAFSMNMLFANEGKQFTAPELEELLTITGFRDVTVTPTYGYYSLVSARKP